MTRQFMRIAIVAAIIGGTISSAQADIPERYKPSWEFSVNSGRLFSAGTQPGVVKGAEFSAAQLFYLPSPDFAVTSAVGWGRSRDLSMTGSPKLDIFTYDIGAEARADRQNLSRSITFSPFLGAGVGARSYSYRDLPISTASQPAGYVSAGGEFGHNRVRLRVELRDYLSSFRPRNSGAAELRNDMTLIIGLRLIEK